MNMIAQKPAHLIDISAIRATYPLSAVIGAAVPLRRAGREYVACCPFHADRSPSFTVNDEKGFYHCFGCGAHGDVLDFIQATEKVGLREAAERLGSGNLPIVVPNTAASCGTLPDRDTTAEALEIWRNASPVKGTPAESYLRARGLICRIPECLRYARLRYGKRGQEHPCLVAAVAGPDDRLTGIQRTYLNASGTGKASVPKPKLSLGRIRGGAIRLSAGGGELIVAEGLEDAMTLWQELGTTAWASAGAGMLANMVLPAGVRSVIIGADRDEAGLRAAREAAKTFGAHGRTVRIIKPEPGFKDFNAELQGVRT